MRTPDQRASHLPLWTLVLLLLPSLARPGGRMAPLAEDAQHIVRTFSVGESRQYRIQLVVRAGVAGSHAEKVGNKAYLRPFDDSAEETLQWHISARTGRIFDNGEAQISEQDTDFSMNETHALAPGRHSAQLQDGLRSALSGWIPVAGHSLDCSYRESPAGDPLQVPSYCGPILREGSPNLLSRWLLLAIRPAAALPEHPIELGATWKEPRLVKLPGWSETQASEENTWLPPDKIGEKPAVRLLTVQQVSGNAESDEKMGANVPGYASSDSTAVPVRAAFHAESLATISMQSGVLLAASRSASREFAWIRASPDAKTSPHFSSRLEAEITIDECQGSCAPR